jgi:hypothetical protein
MIRLLAHLFPPHPSASRPSFPVFLCVAGPVCHRSSLRCPYKTSGLERSGLKRSGNVKSGLERSGNGRSGVQKVRSTKGPAAKGPKEKVRMQKVRILFFLNFNSQMYTFLTDIFCTKRLINHECPQR